MSPVTAAIVADLREQAAQALRELLDAFQRAGAEESDLLRTAPGGLGEVCAGLVTALMRMLVALVAEARGLLPTGSERYRAMYSLSAIDEVYGNGEGQGREASSAGEGGAWARVLRLFRLLHEGPAGEESAFFSIPWVSPARRARFFDPDAYPFLEGRSGATKGALPRIADAAVLRAIDLLRRRKGERIPWGSYDVEHIGGIYESLTGFSVEEVRGPSVVLLPDRVVVSLEALLAMPGIERPRALKRQAGVELSERPASSVCEAASIEELYAALVRRCPPESFTNTNTNTKILPAVYLYLQPGEGRRRAGSYYTPRALAGEVVARALDPLLKNAKSPGAILELRVCDPAMGGGAFLVEACRQIADRLAAAWESEQPAAAAEGVEDKTFTRARARRLVVERCLFGVDQSPLAVELAKVSLWLLAESPDLPLAFLDDRLLCGDSLIGADICDIQAYPVDAWRRELADASERPKLRAILARCEAELAAIRAEPGGADPAKKSQPQIDLNRNTNTRREQTNLLNAWTALWFWPAADGSPDPPTPSTFADYLQAATATNTKSPEPRVALARSIARSRRFFHWRAELPAVFQGPNGGFDALIGNPPWVAYAGRAAQPIEPAVHNFFLRRSPAFFGYRSLHGLFIHRCASLLRPGGRLGLVVPTSVSDLDGYEATRAAHDALCEPDPELPDFGSDAFDGVFQPAMGLLSTRRAPASDAPRAPGSTARSAPVWPLSRGDLDSVAARLLNRLSALPPLPPSLFGERGFQTSAADRPRIRLQAEPIPPYTCPLREGSDVSEYIVRPPRLYIDRAAVISRFRSDDEWRAVKLYIRQTARYPIVALGDGLPFRNSILAGFASERLSEFALLCYLNAWPVRWLHFMRNRDARQGMPQVKIAHLRAIPALPPDRADLAQRLDAIGRRVGPANVGISGADRIEIEAIVAEALAMTDEERRCVQIFAEKNPLPKPER